MKVSICIPVYENPEGLKRLLTSVAMQTFQDFEVIITDDSKEPCKPSILSPFAGRITYVHNKTALGAPKNWNAAIALAKGDYVKIMHGDDSFTDRDCLQTFVDLLDENPEADLAFSGSRQMRDGVVERDRCTPEEDIERFRRDYRLLYTGNTIGAPSAVMVRRSALLSHQITYDETLTWLVDSDYYMQILRQNPHFAFSEKPLVTIHLSKGQLTESVGTDPKILRREYLHVYEKFELWKVPSCKAKLASVLAENPERGDTAAAFHLEENVFREAKREERKRKLQRRFDTNEYLYGKLLSVTNRGFLSRLWDGLFVLAFLIELSIVIIDKSAILNPYESYLFRLTFLLFGAKAVFGTRYTRKERIFFFAALVLSVISYRASGRNEILRYTVFAMALLGMDLRKVEKISFFGTLGGCVLLALLSIFGGLGTVTVTEVIDGTSPVTRLCLGMGHPNSMYCMYMVVILLGLYIWWDQVRPWQLVLLLLLNGALYATARAAMPFLVLLAALVLALTKKAPVWKKNAPYIVLEALFAAGLCICLAGAVWNPAEHALLHRADSIMTGRISALWDTIYDEGTIATWSLFSSPANSYFFDLGFVRLFYWYGLIPGTAMVWLIFEIFHAIRKKRDVRTLVFFGVLILYTLFEAHLVSVYIGRDVLLFVFAAYFRIILSENGGETEHDESEIQDRQDVCTVDR